MEIGSEKGEDRCLNVCPYRELFENETQISQLKTAFVSNTRMR
jgi:hypothetical protein